MTRYTQAQADRVAAIILIQCADGNGEWKHIVEAITKAGLAPKNWLKVRGILQGLLNTNQIERTNSTAVEEYVTKA